ncbi:MAG: hypothetical protein CM15mP68_0850 [Pseudomonadota bacterium]|nr:MAG: hypothetical protein CM15mP68_0850 [Pseudomonadota bacterium]
MVWVQVNHLHKMLARLFTLFLGKVQFSQPIKRIGCALAIGIVRDELLEILDRLIKLTRACSLPARRLLARCGFLWATSQPLFARYQVSLFAVQVEAAPLLVPPIVYQGLGIDPAGLFATVARDTVVPPADPLRAEPLVEVPATGRTIRQRRVVG